MKTIKLPDWNTCQRKVKAGTASVLETYIEGNELAGIKDSNGWRSQLKAVLNESGTFRAPLPEWGECHESVKAKVAHAIEIYIYNNEPSADDPKWRTDLTELLLHWKQRDN